MEKFVLILSQIFMYVGFLVLLYIVYRVKNLKVQAPLDIKHPSNPTIITNNNIETINYEYDIIYIQSISATSYENLINSIKETINTKSNEGWEFICADGDKYIFRKLK